MKLTPQKVKKLEQVYKRTNKKIREGLHSDVPKLKPELMDDPETGAPMLYLGCDVFTLEEELDEFILEHSDCWDRSKKLKEAKNKKEIKDLLLGISVNEKCKIVYRKDIETEFQRLNQADLVFNL